MFDVGFSELILLAIVALVVLGPEKLPHAARVAGAWVARIRRTVSTMQAEIEREVSAQELKTRMEKEFGPNAMGGLVQQLQQEKTAIENDFKEAENIIAPAAIITQPTALVADSGTASTVATAIDPPPAPMLADVATPLADVNMDGEAAYRQWLEGQKRRNSPVTSAETPATSDTPAGDSQA
ncbi:MAG: Sec-independent protein translocase protein TatB [Moraxellaceae bacterium]